MIKQIRKWFARTLLAGLIFALIASGHPSDVHGIGIIFYTITAIILVVILAVIVIILMKWAFDE